MRTPPTAAPPRHNPVPPPAIAGRASSRASAQRFTSFANRVAASPANPAPPGDELVPLGTGEFGAKDESRGLTTRPDGTYNFVRTQGSRRMDQRTLISAKTGHAQLAAGKPVVYAGTVRFSGGALDWWSNYSGHYQPSAAFRAQAQLPADKFVPWQQLQMGGTAMQRGMFRDRRPKATPAVASGAGAEKGTAGKSPDRSFSAAVGTAEAAASPLGASSGEGKKSSEGGASWH
jgi:hypothetical protein